MVLVNLHDATFRGEFECAMVYLRDDLILGSSVGLQNRAKSDGDLLSSCGKSAAAFRYPRRSYVMIDISSNEKAPLPSDSAYFTTSESKAKLLTRLRGNGSSLQDGVTTVTDQQQLHKKKEELVASIGRKLEILRAEREAIKEEMRLNQELGSEVTSLVEERARLAESEKYKLHVEEIDKITSLLLGLSGRLARAENALMLSKEADPEERRILEGKRDKLSEQLEEAKRLKENIDRRAIQVSKVLNQYLNEDEYADYDHFIKMKAKLIMDAREIDDKIKLGEEQQQALIETICKK